MSIWRSIDCPKCNKDNLDIADNGVNLDLRLSCRDCEHEFILSHDGLDWRIINKKEGVLDFE